MHSRPWKTNVATRIREFMARYELDSGERASLAGFASRLKIDPFDVWARPDASGEYYCVVHTGPPPTRRIGVGYRIDNSSFRTVDVIAFEMLSSNGV